MHWGSRRAIESTVAAVDAPRYAGCLGYAVRGAGAARPRGAAPRDARAPCAEPARRGLPAARPRRRRLRGAAAAAAAGDPEALLQVRRAGPPRARLPERRRWPPRAARAGTAACSPAERAAPATRLRADETQRGHEPPPPTRRAACARRARDGRRRRRRSAARGGRLDCARPVGLRDEGGRKSEARRDSGVERRGWAVCHVRRAGPPRARLPEHRARRAAGLAGFVAAAAERAGQHGAAARRLDLSFLQEPQLFEPAKV